MNKQILVLVSVLTLILMVGCTSQQVQSPQEPSTTTENVTTTTVEQVTTTIPEVTTTTLNIDDIEPIMEEPEVIVLDGPYYDSDVNLVIGKAKAIDGSETQEQIFGKKYLLNNDYVWGVMTPYAAAVYDVQDKFRRYEDIDRENVKYLLSQEMFMVLTTVPTDELVWMDDSTTAVIKYDGKICRSIETTVGDSDFDEWTGDDWTILTQYSFTFDCFHDVYDKAVQVEIITDNDKFKDTVDMGGYK